MGNRRWAAFVAMLAVGWFFRRAQLTDWDAWDYAAQAIMGQSSDLALGRWWFVAVMRGAWLVGHGLLGLGTAEAYLPMQMISALMMAGAVVVGMAWTRRLTGSAAAECIFAAMVVLGPIIGIYTFSVMTEAMTLLTLSLAVWAWEVARQALCRGHLAPAWRGRPGREVPGDEAEIGSPHAGKMPAIRADRMSATRRAWLWALAAGLAFGVAVDVREPVLLVGAWPLLSCLVDRRPGRWRLLATAGAGAVLTLAIGVLGAWAWYPWTGMAVWQVAGQNVDVSYFVGMGKWMEQMAREKMQFPLSVAQNLVFLFKYGASEIPVAAFLAVPAIAWAAFRFRKGLWLAVGLLPLAALLVLDHTLQVNPRHPLPLLWLLTPVVAAAVEGWAEAIVKETPGQPDESSPGCHGCASQQPCGKRMRPGTAADSAAVAPTEAYLPKSPRRRLALAMAVVLAGNAAALTYALGYRVIQEEYYDYVRRHQQAFVAMRRMPADAVVVSGPGTPAAYFLTRIKEKDFETIASGWAWPENLGEIIDQRMREGRQVYVYWDASAWGGSSRKSGEWDRLQEAVAKYELADAPAPFRKLRLPPRPLSGPGTTSATAPVGTGDSAGRAATGPRPLP